LIVVPAGRVSVSLALGNAFSHAWLRAGIEPLAGWAPSNKKTVLRTWSRVAGTMIKAHPRFYRLSRMPGRLAHPGPRAGKTPAHPGERQKPGRSECRSGPPIPYGDST